VTAEPESREEAAGRLLEEQLREGFRRPFRPRGSVRITVEDLEDGSREVDDGRSKPYRPPERPA
jgi:hypothetical protein